MKLSRAIVVGLIPIFIGCAALIDLEPGELDPSLSGSSLGSGGADAGIECMTNDDCPVNSECTSWGCTNGVCVLNVTPDGTPIATGAVTGDCKKNVCQEGKPAVLLDDTDLVPDNDPCTVETCNAGTKEKSPAPDGTACGEMGKLGCSNGLCEGCNQDPANCNAPTQCQKVTCTVNTCVYETLMGQVVNDAAQDDCKQDVCDANGNVATVGDATEVPPQVGDKCKAEACLADGTIGQINASEGEKCANPIGACYNDSMCVSGGCAAQPKPMSMLGDDGIAGNCISKYCDGNGMEVTLANDADVPNDADSTDCKSPQCIGGVPSDKNAVNGANCASMGGDKCCGGTCCADTGPGYCDKNNVCCASGKTCAGNCCPNASDNCLNNTCCAGNVCGSTCCQTDHLCASGGVCCPASQRCPNGLDCCPTGQTCNGSNQCS